MVEDLEPQSKENLIQGTNISTNCPSDPQTISLILLN